MGNKAEPRTGWSPREVFRLLLRFLPDLADLCGEELRQTAVQADNRAQCRQRPRPQRSSSRMNAEQLLADHIEIPHLLPATVLARWERSNWYLVHPNTPITGSARSNTKRAGAASSSHRVNAIALAPAFERGFQTRDAELALARMLGDLPDN